MLTGNCLGLYALSVNTNIGKVLPPAKYWDPSVPPPYA